MRSNKAQTSTEFMAIVATVLVIGVVVFGIFEFFPSTASKTSKDVNKVNFKTDEVGIEDYYFGATYSIIKLKNNAPGKVKITTLRYNDNDSLLCTSLNSKLPVELELGKSVILNCAIGKNEYPFPDSLTPIISVRYIDEQTGAAYTSGTGNLILAQVGEIDNCTKYGNCPQPFNCNNAATYHNGSGTIGSPYGICNWAQLNNIRNNPSSNFILLSDLNSNTYGYEGIGDDWQPIGNASGNQFSGKFNGNRNTVYNLFIDKSSSSNVGFFGYTSGDIYDLGLVNVEIHGSSNVGGLVGYQAGGAIYNSYLDGTVYGSGNSVGGLVGYLGSGTITDCYTMGSLHVS